MSYPGTAQGGLVPVWAPWYWEGWDELEEVPCGAAGLDAGALPAIRSVPGEGMEPGPSRRYPAAGWEGERFRHAGGLERAHSVSPSPVVVQAPQAGCCAGAGWTPPPLQRDTNCRLPTLCLCHITYP